MKPTVQISDSQKAARIFPLSDYNFQPTVEAKSVSSPAEQATKAPAFHELSREFLGAEMSRDYVVELFGFAIISAISVWPIISTIVAVTRMVRNH